MAARTLALPTFVPVFAIRLKWPFSSQNILQRLMFLLAYSVSLPAVHLLFLLVDLAIDLTVNLAHQASLD